MKKHPYLDYYLAKEIVRYREKYGTFATIDDLQKVNLMDGDTFRRIKPYLTVE
jgi:competence ComEA-like helix-hairpin-helix protein